MPRSLPLPNSLRSWLLKRLAGDRAVAINVRVVPASVDDRRLPSPHPPP